MAEKGFGVKEVNLIGASGTPTITSPNNLNLNANNVAISTNVSIGGTLSVTGNVSVGGTLTYEDVTNIDSVGLITARSGLIISGVTTFNTDVDFKGSGGATKILYDASQDALEFADSATLTFGSHPGTGDYQINYVNGGDFAINAMSGGTQDLVIGRYESATQKKHLVSTRAGVIELYHDDSKKLETNSTGVNVTGAITVNGSALSITPTDSDIQVAYTVTSNGSSAYRFAGNGVVSSTDNPDLYLIRGQKYRFINNSGGSHPFQIRESSGGTAYSTGVTNNGAASGNIDFAPTFDSPAQLVYQCTVHGGMVGNIYLKDGTGNETNVGVTTFSGLVHLNQLKKTSGTLDYLAGTHNFANAAGSTNYMTIDSNGDLGLGIAAVPQDSGARTLHVHSTTTGGGARAALRLTHGSTGSTASNGGFLGMDNNPDLYLYNQETGKLRFGTDGSERMQIRSNGNVGINRNDPSSLLHIQTTDTSTYNISSAVTNGILTLGGNNGGASGRCVGLQFNGTASNGEAFITLVSESSTEANLHFGMRSGGSRGDRMRISRGGDIGAPSGNNIYNASDERLKENMIELTDGLNKIKELKPISFNWKEGWNKSLDGVTQYGFGAQTTKAVDEILVEPFGTGDVELNGETIENPLRVNEKYIIPLLVKAIQELSAEVAALKAK